MERKPIKVDEFTHEVYRREALRQSMKDGAVSMCEVLRQGATKLNKKYKYKKEEKKDGKEKEHNHQA